MMAQEGWPGAGTQQPQHGVGRGYGNFPAPAGYGMHYQGQAAPSLSAPHLKTENVKIEVSFSLTSKVT